MNVLNDLVRDLIEKKLWPVAVALLLALIAVPVLLGGGGSDPAPAPVTSAAQSAPRATAAAARSDVALEGDVATKRDRAGKVRNPFQGPKVTDVQVTGQAPASDKGASTPAAGSGGATTAPAPAAKAPAPAQKAKPKTDESTQDSEPQIDDTYKVKLRFGQAGDLKTRRNVARLTPLPSTVDPFFIFLGVLKDGKTAVFLVSTDAVPTGDGKCKPSKLSCETVRLKAGDTEFFDVTNDAGGVTQYQLDLVSVAKRQASSKAVAARSHKRVSKAGKKILKAQVASTLPGLNGWSYDARLGVLVAPRPGERSSGSVLAHIPQALADAADGR
jgi:hypothetical protein